MSIVTNVFFWALVATLGLFVGLVIFTSHRRFPRPAYILAGIAGSLGYLGPRILIPFLPQPSAGIPTEIAWSFGGALVLLGIAIMGHAIGRLRANGRGQATTGLPPLLMDGLYGIVRHPMYLGDVLWSLGLAIALNAVYAVLLVPVWYLLRAGLAVLEEQRLTDKYGETYDSYRAQVPDLILPNPRRLLA
jgi:protein-S-isoprenylcysteine O-methyltransferase Ste14